MLARHELADLNLNAAEVDLGLDRADKMLADVLDVRKTTEAKAQQLFTAYVTIALAVFGLASVIARGGGPKQWGLLAAGALFVVGALMLIRAMAPARYGYLGSSPSMFLERGIIDAPEERTTLSKASILHGYETRIETGWRSNDTKMRWLTAAMVAGVLGAVSVVPAMLAT